MSESFYAFQMTCGCGGCMVVSQTWSDFPAPQVFHCGKCGTIYTITAEVKEK